MPNDTPNAAPRQPLNLLTSGLDASASDPILRLLQGARYAPRAEAIADEAELADRLRQRPWDMLLVNASAGLPLLRISETLRSLSKDIPILVLASEVTPALTIQSLKERASAVAGLDQPEVAVLLMRRELVNLSHRRRRRQLEFFLNEAERRCQELMDSSTQPLAFINREGSYLYCNSSYAELLGYDNGQVLRGKSIAELAAQEDQGNLTSFLSDFLRSSEGGDEHRLRAQRADGSQFNLFLKLQSARFAGQPAVEVSLTPPDQEVELDFMAQKDLVTGLKNQNYLVKKVAQAVESASRGGNQTHLLYVAVNNYHAIKTDSGAQAADNLIRDLATTLQSEVNRAHQLTRFNLDAFAILFMDDSPERSQALAEKLWRALQQRGESNAGTHLSIGIAPITDSVHSADEALRLAQLAAEKAHGRKDSSSAPIHLFRPSDIANSESESVASMRKAVAENRFRLLFQPIVSLHGDPQHLYEVLLRLVDEEGQQVSPALFMSTLDDPEIALLVDRWVIRDAIRQLAAEYQQGHNHRLFINLTGRSLLDPELLPWLSDQLSRSKLPGNSLVFQFSEADASSNMKYAKLFVEGLRQLHVQSCIKHYGSGIDTQAVLKNVATEYIKLDGSFVQELESAEKMEAFSKLMEPLRLGGKTVIAPLVEGTTVMSRLWQTGVHYLQGFYLQAPQPDMSYDYFNEGD